MLSTNEALAPSVKITISCTNKTLSIWLDFMQMINNIKPTKAFLRSHVRIVHKMLMHIGQWIELSPSGCISQVDVKNKSETITKQKTHFSWEMQSQSWFLVSRVHSCFTFLPSGYENLLNSITKATDLALAGVTALFSLTFHTFVISWPNNSVEPCA